MAICFSNYQIELFSLCFTEQGINISKSQKRNASSLIRKSEMPSSTRACEDTEFDDNQLESSEIEK